MGKLAVLTVVATTFTAACITSLEAGTEPSAMISQNSAISDIAEVTIGNPGDDEVFVAAPAGAVVVGLGALISSSSNNYTAIRVDYRMVNDDGTLGPPAPAYGGTHLNTQQFEAWCPLSEGNVLTGLEVNGKSDVKRMLCWYSPLDLGTMRLRDRAILPVIKGLDANNTNLAPTVSYFPEQQGFDASRAVIYGVGLTATSGGTTHMHLAVGFLR